MMKKKRLEETLLEALNEARCVVLPIVLDTNRKNAIWAQAIVKVTKCDMTENYALAINNGRDIPVIVKDFGSAAAIVSIDSIHPYSYFPINALPDLRKKSEILSFLVSYGYDRRKIEAILSPKDANGEEKTGEQKREDIATIKSMIYRICINDLILSDKNDKHIETINNYGKEQEESTERAD